MHSAETGASAAERKWLAGVLLIGVALRVGAALYLGNAVGEDMPGLADQLSYHTLAVRVTEGHGFSFGTGWWPATPAGEPTAHWSFLYTLLLSAMYWVVGPQPLAVRLVQAVVVGALHPYLSWRIGRRLFGPRVAIASALIAATYGYFVYYGAALMTEPLYLVGILWVIDVAMRIGDGDPHARGAVWLWWWLGLAIAGTVLLRQVFLLCVPLVIAWIAVRQVAAARGLGLSSGRVLQRLATGTALSALVVVVCVLPFTLRNYLAFERFVPINTNAGFALFWGNHPVHGSRYMPLLPEYGQLIPEDLGGLNEAALDQALLVRGAAFVTADPRRYLRLCLGRVREYFKFWPSPESSAMSNAVRTGSFGLFLPFMIGGIALVFAGRQPGAGAPARDRGASLLPLVVAAGYTMIHVMIWALVRYRLPVDALLVPFAGVSVMWVVDRVGTQRLAGAPLVPRQAP